MIVWIILLVLLIPLLSILLDSRLGQALASRVERQAISGGDPATHERIAFLEGEVERLGREMERLEEESEFLHKLLTERSSAPDALPGPGDDRHAADG